MKTWRPVTERDLRRPECLEGTPDDYEFRDDGSVARKDRWEQGIRKIAGVLGLSATSFEIEDIVKKVEELKNNK